MQGRCSTLSITLNNKQDWMIKSVLLQNEQIFPQNNGTLVQVFSTHLTSVSIPLTNAKNKKETIDAKLIIGQGLDSGSFITVELPPIEFKIFQMFQLSDNNTLKTEPEHNCKLLIEEVIDLQIFTRYIENSFPYPQDKNLNMLIKQ